MTAKICGLRLRYDVPTKCNVVATILSKTYSTNEELVASIKEQSALLNVTYLTVRTWIAMYEDSYKIGMTLPKGVMSHSFTTINNKTDLKLAFKELTKIREEVEVIKSKREKSNNPAYARPKTKKTSQQILSALIEEVDSKKVK